MHAIWVFAAGLKHAYNYIAAVGLLLCLLVLAEGYIQSKTPLLREVKYRQIKMAIQVLFLGSLVWMILSAIPEPNYHIQYVKEPVKVETKIVTVHDTFKDLWDHCNDSYSLEGVPGNIIGGIRNDRMKICTEMALKGSRQFANDNQPDQNLNNKSGVDNKSLNK